MSGQGQDFILFSEQQTDSWVYKSEKLLHTYMNRLAIDEDDQNEILGIQKLKDPYTDLITSMRSEFVYSIHIYPRRNIFVSL